MNQIAAKAEQVGWDKALEGVEDPRIVQAGEAIIREKEWTEELGLNSEDGIRVVDNPRTGQVNAFALRGHPEVFEARDEATKAEDELSEAILPAEKVDHVSGQLLQMAQQASAALEQANQALRETHISSSENIPAVKVLGRKRPTPYGKAGIVKDFSATGGYVDGLIKRVRDGEYLTAIRQGNLMLKRMDKWSPTSVDASDEIAPMQAVRTQVENVVKTSKALMEARKQAHTMVHGRAKAWKGETKYRDALHKEAVKSLDSTQKARPPHPGRQAKGPTRLSCKSWVTKRREINTRYAKERSDRTHTLADGLRNIDENTASKSPEPGPPTS